MKRLEGVENSIDQLMRAAAILSQDTIEGIRREGPPVGIPRFEHSLFVWTTAMSRPAPDRAVVDAGLKASSVDSGMPRVAELEGAEYVKASDEHGVLKLGGSVRLAVGDKLKLIPGHCDPTVNLYDQYVCVRGGRVEAIWPITARGCSQ